jgi:RNA polymerase sigma-70 factor (ECF subfamily)
VSLELSGARPWLWALAYRLTGCAADADDAVQETLARALAHPPHGELRPWLTRVLVNHCRDELRKRRRAGYVGPWLPSPVPTDDEPPSAEPIDLAPGAEARYSLLESASMAFLLALEALTPAQRAVLLLRDVFDLSVREVAQSLGLTEANVKVIHHRARLGMAAYEQARLPLDAARRGKTQEVLQAFLGLLASGDAEGAARLLAPDARVTTDAGGEYVAALQTVAGSERALRFLLALTGKTQVASFDVRELNGLPALVADMAAHPARWAPRLVLAVELDAQDRIAHVRIVLASRKLTAVPHAR